MNEHGVAKANRVSILTCNFRIAVLDPSQGRDRVRDSLSSKINLNLELVLGTL